MVKIVHISDTHGYKWHNNLVIPECDLLLHSGDIGGRTNLKELTEFLIWFEQQPAKVKIFCAGNHDIVLDKQCYINMRKPEYINAYNSGDVTQQLIMKQAYEDAMALIDKYEVKYLNCKEFIYEGLKIFGFPYTPSFHKYNGWAFNADRGAEMQKYQGRIPSDTDILITHGPPYGIMDEIPEKLLKPEDEGEYKRGCHDMLNLIKKRLHSLQLVCFGHIHDQVGVRLINVSNTRKVLFSNGAVITNEGIQNIIHPLIITL